MVQMALRTVAYIILALVSIGLVLSLIPRLSESANRQYCSAYTKGNLAPGAQIPEECIRYAAGGGDRTAVLSGNASEVSSSLAAYIVSCGKLKAGTCYTVQLSSNDRQLTNSDVLDVLAQRGINASVKVPDMFANNSLLVIGYDEASGAVVVK